MKRKLILQEKGMPSNPQKKTILLVEDEIIIAKSETMLLETYGYECIIAKSGEKALEILINEPEIDLILMDIILPGINGYQTCRELKKNPAFNDIPVIFLSSTSTDFNKIEAFKSGGVDFVEKSAEIDLLILRIETHLKIFSLQKNLTQKSIKLKESESKYRFLAENTSDWIFWVSPENRFLYLSPSSFKFTGYSASEFIHNPNLLEEIIYPEDQELYRNHKKSILKCKENELEFRITHKNGSIKWINHKCQALYDNEVHYLGTLSTNIDITEKKLSEQELEKYKNSLEELVVLQIKEIIDNENKLRSIFDNVLTGVVVADISGNLLNFNPAFQKITQYSSHELKNLHFSALNHSEDIEKETELLHQIRTNKIESFTIEKRYIQKDGKIIWVRLNVNVLRNENKIPNRFVAIIEDIHAQKTAEQSLKESETRYRTILENTPDWELHYSSQGDLLYTNLNYIQITGFTDKNSFNKIFLLNNLFLPEDAVQVSEKIQTVFTNKGTLNDYEVRILKKDSSISFVSVSSQPIITSDNLLLGIRVSIRDINKRKKMEETNNLQQKLLERMEKHATIGFLSSAIAHEIKQPLQLIRVVADTLVMRINKKIEQDEIDRKNIKNLLDLSGGVDRINNIINNMLRIFKTSEIIQLKKVNLKQVVNNTARFYTNKLSSHLIRLKTSEIDSGLFVLAEENLLLQVFSNLLNNAIDALNSMSKNNKEIVFNVFLDQNQVVVEISDNGPGIKPEHQEKIFAPLFSTKENSDSMGMGLYIVQNILKSMDSSIKIAPNPIEGAAFQVFLNQETTT